MALNPATVNRELACLKILLNRCDCIGKNPVSAVKFLNEDNEQMRVVSGEEEKLYLMACSQPLQDVATVMIETGARPEEICKLRRQDVHLERGYLHIPFGKTKAARRKIPLTDKALLVLEGRVKDAEGEYLFAGRGSKKGEKPVIKLNRAHNGAVERSKVAWFRLYDLRHTFAARATEAGIDLVTLAALLGHSRVQMVMRYAHPTEEHQFGAIRKMQAFRGRKKLPQALAV
jgi:integrase